MTLEQRIKYLLYWGDKEKRERGFLKADAILLKLFEGFNLEEEMRIDFTEDDERRWNRFNQSKVTKKECVVWNKYEWRYLVRTCGDTDLCSGLSMMEIG